MHHVTTEDGYILEMHRVTGSPDDPSPKNKPVVLVMHGMLSSSADFVLMGPNTALAYMLADRGFDVWMGNARGNRYGLKHTHLNEHERDFWQFSWHEIGTTDLPAMIEYISEQTGSRRMHYIGHSQGTTVFWVMCAERPEYNSRIISMNALAPAAYMHNTRSPGIWWLATWLTSVTVALEMSGTWRFEPTDEMSIAVGEEQCRDGAPTQEMCANEIFWIAGWNTQEMNFTMLPVINGHSPAGAATMQMIHYGQIVRFRAFRKYDHGWWLNTILYGTTIPPRYNLDRVTAPVALYHSTNDWMASPPDVRLLRSDLPNVVLDYLVPMPEFNHMDFIWAINQRTLLHERVISHMEEMNALYGIN